MFVLFAQEYARICHVQMFYGKNNLIQQCGCLANDAVSNLLILGTHVSAAELDVGDIPRQLIRNSGEL